MAEFVCPHCHAIFREQHFQCPNDGSLLIEVPQLNDLSGQVFRKKYRLDKALGHGGFGSVYEATHLILGKRVAVKVLRTEFRSDSTMVARFFNEARVVTRLANPHTIATFDLDQTEEGLLFMVMDYVTGQTLRQLAEKEGEPKGRLPWPRALSLLCQVCDSLDEAHQHGVIHRDLKPDNVMVSNRGGEKDFVTVLDFGIAKVFEGSEMQNLTAEGSLIGSPAYMSPEQILGRTLDPRSDLYSLGAVAYQVISGTLPVNARQTAAMLQEKVLSSPIPIRKKAPEVSVPLKLEDLLLELLATRPDDRPGTAADVKARFVSILAESGAYVPFGATATTLPPTPDPGTQSYDRLPVTPSPETPDRTQALGTEDTAHLDTLEQKHPAMTPKDRRIDPGQASVDAETLAMEEDPALLDTLAPQSMPPVQTGLADPPGFSKATPPSSGVPSARPTPVAPVPTPRPAVMDDGLEDEPVSRKNPGLWIGGGLGILVLAVLGILLGTGVLGGKKVEREVAQKDPSSVTSTQPDKESPPEPQKVDPPKKELPEEAKTGSEFADAAPSVAETTPEEDVTPQTDSTPATSDVTSSRDAAASGLQKAPKSAKVKEEATQPPETVERKAQSPEDSEAREAARKKAEEEARFKAEQENAKAAAALKAEEEARQKVEDEKKKAEEEAARKKAEDETARAAREAEEASQAAALKAEQDARAKAEEEKSRAQAEARKKAEEEKKKAEEDAARKKAEEEKKKADAEAARKKAEEERKKAEAEEKKRKEAMEKELKKNRGSSPTPSDSPKGRADEMFEGMGDEEM